MVTNPLFTIFIPTIGRLNYLREAVASARAQSYPNIEILVGDERSQDGTHEYLLKLVRQEPRLRFYRSETKLGMPGNWQKGLDDARGEYFSLVSDDDILMEDFAARCVAQFLADSSLQVVATLHRVIDEHGGNNERLTAERDAFFTAQLSGNPKCDVSTFPPMMSSAFRRDWALQIGFWDGATMAADVDFFRRAGAKGYRCQLIAEHLMQYRIHGGSMTSARTVDQGRGNLHSVLRVEQEYPECLNHPSWQALRISSIYSLIHTLTRLGKMTEAGNLLFRFGNWLPFGLRIKCAGRILASPILASYK